jgi:hypothetical protein
VFGHGSAHVSAQFFHQPKRLDILCCISPHPLNNSLIACIGFFQVAHCSNIVPPAIQASHPHQVFLFSLSLLKIPKTDFNAFQPRNIHHHIRARFHAPCQNCLCCGVIFVFWNQ